MKTDWRDALRDFLVTPTFARLLDFVDRAYADGNILPPKDLIYTALQLCSFAETRVVILGQDPYPTPGHAHGLAFSVLPPNQPPPSLRNIFTEIQSDLGRPAHVHGGDLTPWAKQGVLLLNAILTVHAHAPLSHAGKGWEPFTDALIRLVSERRPHVVFLLWGAKAKAKIPLIDSSKHLILTAPHPSPLSAHTGFFGCKCFSRANAWLTAQGLAPIDW